MQGKHGSAAELSARSPAAEMPVRSPAAELSTRSPAQPFRRFSESRNIRAIDSQLNFRSKSLLPLPQICLLCVARYSRLNLRFEQRYFGQLELVVGLSAAVLTSPARRLLVRLATPSPTDAETCHIAMLSAYLQQILPNLVPTHLFFSHLYHSGSLPFNLPNKTPKQTPLPPSPGNCCWSVPKDSLNPFPCCCNHLQLHCGRSGRLPSSCSAQPANSRPVSPSNSSTLGKLGPRPV